MVRQPAGLGEVAAGGVDAVAEALDLDLAVGVVLVTLPVGRAAAAGVGDVEHLSRCRSSRACTCYAKCRNRMGISVLTVARWRSCSRIPGGVLNGLKFVRWSVFLVRRPKQS